MKGRSRYPYDEVDSPRSWAVAIAASVVLSCNIWTFRCSGVVYVALHESLNITREEAVWPVVMFSVASTILGPLVGYLSHRFEIRTLFLFSTTIGAASVILASYSRNILEITILLGFIQGLCSGFPVTLAGVVVTSYFDKYRTTAIGVFLSGPALVSFLLPTLMKYSITHYGLSWSLFYFSGVTMQSIPAALLCRTFNGIPDEEQIRVVVEEAKDKKDDGAVLEVNANPNAKRIPAVVLRQLGNNRVRRDTPRVEDDENESLQQFTSYENDKVYKIMLAKPAEEPKKRCGLFGVFKLKWFYITCLANVMFLYTNSTLLNLIVDFALDKNLDQDTAVYLVSLFAIGDLFGRVGSGWITDKGFLNRESLLLLNFSSMAIILTVLCHILHHIILYILVALVGWLLGSSVILFMDIFRDRLGVENLAVASGWNFFFAGVLIATRPPTIGYFRDTIGSYSPVFYIMSASLILVCLIYLPARCLDKGEPKEEPPSSEYMISLKEGPGSRTRSRNNSFTPSISSM